jgi:hypothetical protein
MSVKASSFPSGDRSSYRAFDRLPLETPAPISGLAVGPDWRGHNRRDRSSRLKTISAPLGDIFAAIPATSGQPPADPSAGQL